MREDIAGPRGASSRPMWETLEGMVREKAQEFIQQIMEEEVTELLGRERSECRSTVDSAEGYRNGYGKPRQLAMSSGTITLRRPRVRGVEERFESRVLPLFATADGGAGRSASGAVSARTGGGRLRAGDAGTARRGGHRCRSLRFGDCGRDGRRSSRNGASVAWRAVRSSTYGRTGALRVQTGCFRWRRRSRVACFLVPGDTGAESARSAAGWGEAFR